MAEVEVGLGKSGRRAYGFDDIAIVPSRRTRDPEDVDIKEPPMTVNSIKNKDKSNVASYDVIPEVEIDETTARKIFNIPSEGTIKK